jgi:hypothetical protein
MKLSDIVEQGGDFAPPRIGIYGDEKVGKTRLLADSRNPIYHGTDDGCRRLNVPHLPFLSDWETYLSQLGTLVGEAKDSGFQTIVLDTLNGTNELCAEFVCKKYYDNNWADAKKGFNAWGEQGWNQVAQEWKQPLEMYDSLIEQGLWVVFLSHTGISKVQDPMGGDYHRFQPDMDRRVWNPVARWLDVILRADFEKTYSERDGKRIAVSSDRRVLRCEPNIQQVGGCRVGYELPEEMDLDWKEVEKHLGEYDSSMEDEIRSLWNRLEREQQDKALNNLGIKRLSDIRNAPSHKARKLLEKMRTLKEKE